MEPPRRGAPPAIGGNRSSKRDRILEVFFRQEGHLSADELYAAVRREQPRIGRATVYRTLQRMVDAGLAHRVDFGDGRWRYEASPGRPRHSHLVCAKCHSSSEFLSADIEAQLDAIAAARGFAPTHTVVQIHGLCEQCRTGKTTPSIDGPATRWVFARDALRVATATGRAAADFHARAARVTRDAGIRQVFETLAGEERSRVADLEARYAALLAENPQLEAWPPFLFFTRPPADGFAAAAKRLRAPGASREALRLAVACERDSHRFFEEGGGRFEDSEGKAIFLSAAEAERSHLKRLIRAHRRRKSGSRASR